MECQLTVPFALAAGLSGAVQTTGVIVTASLAEIVAGSIAMGLGGYLAAKSDAEHYFSERTREEAEVSEKPDIEADEVARVFQSYGLPTESIGTVVAALRQRPQAWVDFMMRFELGLEKPDPKRAFISAATIAGAYIAGGFVPLGPYIVLSAVHSALIVSVMTTLIALSVFGYVKVALPVRHRSAAPAKQCSLAGWRQRPHFSYAGNFLRDVRRSR